MGLFDQIGGVVGGLLGGGGQGGTETTQLNLSPQQQAAQDQLLQQSQDFQNQPFRQFGGPRTAQFGQEFQQGANALQNLDPRIINQLRQSGGGLGIGQGFTQNFLGQQGPGGGLDFNNENIARFSDPFTQQVIDAQGRTFDRFRDRASQDIGDQFQAAGAFGGSRQAVTEGARLGELDTAEAQQIANLRSQGFNQAQNALFNQQGRFDQFQGQQLGAAQGLSNLGFGANQQLLNAFQQAGQSGLNIGDMLRQVQQQDIDRQRGKFGEQREQDIQNLGLSQSILGGLPQQGSSTRTQTAPPSNVLGSLLGLGGTIFGGPIGGAIGSGLGSLFGGGGEQAQFDPNQQSQTGFGPAGLFGV